MNRQLDQDALEEVYLLLCKIRYFLHQEDLDINQYELFANEHYAKIAEAASVIGDMLDADRLEKITLDAD